ncbi:methyltransferase [Candidatus Epulonipiscioides gigas]|nr:methyltransferase [Epulopiscium sp. SCG-C07WGA-EpuloA2]
METYNNFAFVYNNLMEDTPYDQWYKFITNSLKQYNILPKIICDLGAGTGVMCEKFATSNNNLEIIGIDNSSEMLSIATASAVDKNLNILYLNQNITDFELYGTVDLIYSTCDSLNYILEEAELFKIFQLVNNYLEPNGLFIFDISTKYKYEEILSDKTFVNQTDDASYIWENYYDEDERINEFAVTFFIKEENDLYKKTEEFHYQKAYEIEQIKTLLEKAGLIVLGIFDNYTNTPCTDTTTRATFIAKEIKKTMI